MKKTAIANDNSISEVNLFGELVEEVLKYRLRPEDKYEIAAYLESVGWNDNRAAETFGAQDIFELAEDIWDAIQEKVMSAPFIPEPKVSFISQMVDAVRNFIRGTIFALPMAISVIAMLTLRYSLWSYENLSLDLATSIAIGTILSFMTVGGFTQAIARRGFFYITQGYFNMARRIIFQFVRIGFVVCFIFVIITTIFNLFIEMFSFKMVLMINLYYLFLSSIWLSVTVMYILRKEIVFTGLVTAGICIVFVFFELFGFNIILSQIIALTIVSVLAIILVIYYFKIAEQKMEKGIAPSLPRMSITIYSVMPYFIYGFLYFTFLFTDRIISWSTNDDAFMPYIIWFRGSYELGLDFALLMLMIPMGLIEVVVNKLMNNVEYSQKSNMLSDIAEMNNGFLKVYISRLLITSVISIICAIGVYLMVEFIDKNYSSLMRTSLLSNQTSKFVFIVALISYSILTVGLMNSIVLFSLSQPELVNSAILKSLLVNIGVGFLSSRWASWWFSQQTATTGHVAAYALGIMGLLAGTVVFVIITTKQVLKVLDNLDYYFYALS